MENKLIVLSGPSASGKTTLVKSLKEKYPIIELVSHTTRKPRDGERNGVAYYFVDTEEFNHMVAEGRFIEHVAYAGNQYGLMAREAEKKLKQGHCCVIVDTVGMLALSRSSLADRMITVFVNSRFQSHKDMLREMDARGDELSREEAEMRVNRAVFDRANAGNYQHHITQLPGAEAEVSKAHALNQLVSALKFEGIVDDE